MTSVNLSLSSAGGPVKIGALFNRYILDAMAVERSGAKVELKKTADFAALTPGRQRAYLLFFGGAKQAATREARIAKHQKDILAGKGLHD